MEPSTQAKLSLLISILALVVSAAGVIWMVYYNRKDRGRLIADAIVYRFFNVPPGRWHESRGVERDVTGTLSSASVEITVTNVGRRPLKVTGVVGLKRWPKWGVIELSNVEAAKPLGEHESDTARAPIPAAFDGTRGLAVRDASGKLWRVSRKSFRQAKADARTLGLIH
jgi:hypothetical protein